MAKEQSFVDVNNVDVMNYKSLLRCIGESENIEKVPAGYSANFGNVQLSLTRHVFSLSLEGRVILELKRDSCRWSDDDLLRRLGVNRLVEFKIDPSLIDMKITSCKFGEVVKTDDLGTCVGGLLSCLIFLDKLKQRHNLNLLSLTFRVPQREGFTQYYVNTVKGDPECRYFLVDSTPETRRFVYQRLGLTCNPKECSRDNLLVSSVPIDIDCVSRNSGYSALLDPVFCVAVKGMNLHAREITNQVCRVDTSESLPSDKKFEDVLDEVLPSKTSTSN